MSRPDLSDPTIAVINVGNSRLTVALCDPRRHLPVTAGGDHALNQTWPALGEPLSLDHDQAGEVASYLARREFKAAVLVSVVPDMTALLLRIRPDLAVVNPAWSMPFAWGVDAPAKVGADRLANMALASALGLDKALVVDAGTATTFDLLDGGVFRGGLIAPGMAFAAQKLGEQAAQLSPVPFGPCPLEVGTDTAAAMARGAWHTGLLGAHATIDGLLERYGSMPVFLTGGLGEVLHKSGRFYDPYWTLRGAAWLWLNSGR